MKIVFHVSGDIPVYLVVFGFVALWGFAAVVLGGVPLPGRIAVLLGLATTVVGWRFAVGLALRLAQLERRE